MTHPFIRQTQPFDLPGFEQIVGARPIQVLKQLAREAHLEFHRGNQPVTVWHINSSAIGGGVADILNHMTPLSNQIGITSHWFVIGGDANFFQVTKSFHNALQGSPDASIVPEMFAHYDAITQRNGELLDHLFVEQELFSPDVIMIHDPQPAALIPHLQQRFPDSIVVWRGHIHFDFQSSDMLHPGWRVWQFLLGYINQCDGAIFHLPEMIPPGINIPTRCVLPSINPLALINRDLSHAAAIPFIDGTLLKYGLERFQDPSVPMLLQNGRFDPWKDPIGVIEAVREARKLLATQSKLPELVLVGPLAGDDPESGAVLGELRQLLNGDGAVHLIPIDPKHNVLTAGQMDSLYGIGLGENGLSPENVMELEINALQTRADIIIAKSLREGFGLAVTGAGYHAKSRIVSQVGGLAHQVAGSNGDLLAALVGGAPDFSRQVSIEMTRDWIVKLLTTPELRRTMGASANQHVIENFLPHRHLSDYLKIFLQLRRHKRSEKIRLVGC